MSFRWSHAPLAREVADIFIPLARNENSAMTVGGGGGRWGAMGGGAKIPPLPKFDEGDSVLSPLRGWIVPVGDAIPDRRGAGVSVGVTTRWRGRFRIFSFRLRQLTMPKSGTGGMKIPE